MLFILLAEIMAGIYLKEITTPAFKVGVVISFFCLLIGDRIMAKDFKWSMFYYFLGILVFSVALYSCVSKM